MQSAEVSEKLKINYKDYYKDGDSEWRRIGAIDKAENIIELCKKLPKRRILEIGAGEGSVLERLSELNFGDELYAVEISQSGVETIINKKIATLVECNIFDGYHVPYENDKFDIVILCHVIEHVEHPRLLLYEAARLAKYVFIEVPLEDTIRLPSNFVFNEVGHINFFTPRSIRNLAQSCDFKVLNQIVKNPPKATYSFQKGKKGLINYYIKQLLMFFSPGLATKLFTYHAALVCER